MNPTWGRGTSPSFVAYGFTTLTGRDTGQVLLLSIRGGTYEDSGMWDGISDHPCADAEAECLIGSPHVEDELCLLSLVMGGNEKGDRREEEPRVRVTGWDIQVEWPARCWLRSIHLGQGSDNVFWDVPTVHNLWISGAVTCMHGGEKQPWAGGECVGMSVLR